MQIVDDLLQVFLGLVLARNIGEVDALGGLNIDLDVAAAHAEHHRVAAAELVRHLLGHILPEGDKDQDGEHPAENVHEQRGLLDLLALEGNARLQKPGGEVVVRHHGGLVDNSLVLIGKENAVVLLLNFDLADLVLLDHLDKGVVVHLLDLVLREPRHGKEIEEKYREHGDGVVEDQRLFRGFDFFHKRPSNIEWDGCAEWRARLVAAVERIGKS